MTDNCKSGINAELGKSHKRKIDYNDAIIAITETVDMNVYKVSFASGEDMFVEVYSTWEITKKRWLDLLTNRYPYVLEALNKKLANLKQVERDADTYAYIEYASNDDDSLTIVYMGDDGNVSLKIEEVDLKSGVPCEF